MTDGMLLARMGEESIGKEATLKDLRSRIWSSHKIESYNPIKRQVDIEDRWK
jgi:hypothetical protein